MLVAFVGLGYGVALDVAQTYACRVGHGEHFVTGKAEAAAHGLNVVVAVVAVTVASPDAHFQPGEVHACFGSGHVYRIDGEVSRQQPRGGDFGTFEGLLCAEFKQSTVNVYAVDRVAFPSETSQPDVSFDKELLKTAGAEH